jgi:hypothetical protein
MYRKVELPTVSNRQNAKDFMVVCDSVLDWAELGEQHPNKHHGDGGDRWSCGGKKPSQVVKDAKHGDLSLVAESDKLIDSLEDKVQFLSSSWKTIDSVVGGAVNAGAYIAGFPLCMRQRKRQAVDTAPMSVVVDLTVSCGLSSDEIAKRGSAVLALVRLLSGVRPVDLYLATCMGGNGETASSGVVAKVDTQPLELATVANAMASTGFVRWLGYGICDWHKMTNGAWPFNDVDAYRRLGRKYWERFCGTVGGELLFVPPAHSDDKLLRRPLEWLQGMLAEYGGVPVAD